MADNAKVVAIRFGEKDSEVDDTQPYGFVKTKPIVVNTGSLWNYRYANSASPDNSTGLSQYSGSIDPIFGPGCRIDPDSNYACYAAPTGHGGPEGSHKYDYVTLKPGQDTYAYLDVGFWGGNVKRHLPGGLFERSRTFGLVCGPLVWLCNYGQVGGAPQESEPPYGSLLSSFQKEMGNFRVLTHATLPFEKSGDWGSGPLNIYVVLPDMHMWPNPEELKKRRKEFFEPDELKILDGSIKDGRLQKQHDGSLDIPAEKGESADDHALRLVGSQEGRAAMKENAMSDTRKMNDEEEKHAFGSTAGDDLVRFLEALKRAKDKKFDVTLLHVGDLLEMWAPYHTWVGPKPFKYEKVLKLSDSANQRIPKWLALVYDNAHNRSALKALDDFGCYQIYGNHDVYLAFDQWNLSGIDIMDRLRHSLGSFSNDDLIWVEHGHRFDPSNRDGYWMWIDLDHPPGPLVNTSVNYYPELRDFGDKYDNSDTNLYKKNVPYATIWYLLARYANVDSRPRLPNSPPGVDLRLPPKFRIFCQGHTHSPVLLKIKIFWSKLEGKYVALHGGTGPVEEQVTKEEQRREQGARDGSYTPGTTEDALKQLEKNRERRVQRDK